MHESVNAEGKRKKESLKIYAVYINMTKMKRGMLSMKQNHSVNQIFENLVLPHFTVMAYSPKLLFCFNQLTKQFRQLVTHPKLLHTAFASVHTIYLSINKTISS